MLRLLLPLIGALALMGCQGAAAALPPLAPMASADDEVLTRETIFGRVKAAIAVEDFAGLSAMERDFRTTRARTPSGVWKLAFYHEGLQSYLAVGLSSDAGCQYLYAPFIARWRQHEPKSPAPAITDAALLLKQAWCKRGRGYSQTVAPDAWPVFRSGVTAAAAALDSAQAISSTDPEFYAVRTSVLRAQGADEASFRALVDEATAREPDYHRTYFNAVWYFLPQWGGSDAAVERFARYAAERSKADEGSALYARVFWSIDECDCDVVTHAADWATLKRSMRDAWNHHPVRWNGRYFADQACKANDVAEGHAYLKVLHPEAKNEASLVALYATCDYYAHRPA